MHQYSVFVKGFVKVFVHNYNFFDIQELTHHKNTKFTINHCLNIRVAISSVSERFNKKQLSYIKDGNIPDENIFFRRVYPAIITRRLYLSPCEVQSKWVITDELNKKL